MNPHSFLIGLWVCCKRQISIDLCVKIQDFIPSVYYLYIFLHWETVRSAIMHHLTFALFAISFGTVCVKSSGISKHYQWCFTQITLSVRQRAQIEIIYKLWAFCFFTSSLNAVRCCVRWRVEEGWPFSGGEGGVIKWNSVQRDNWKCLVKVI